jgi:hypothetical protein
VAQLVSRLLDNHAGSLAEMGISDADWSLTNRVLSSLNRFWSI